MSDPIENSAMQHALLARLKAPGVTVYHETHAKTHDAAFRAGYRARDGRIAELETTLQRIRGLDDKLITDASFRREARKIAEKALQGGDDA